MTSPADTLDELRALLPPGSVAFTELHYVSRDGMTRHLSVKLDHGRDITAMVADVLGERLTARGYIRVRGCGMDMGFHLVYGLSRTLYRDGHYCTGKRGCPSNDHSNDYGRLAREYADKHPAPADTADRDEREAWCAARSEWIARHRLYRRNRLHSDGGYAVSHRWL